MFVFDSNALGETISSLESNQRVTFAVACAERLFGIYRDQGELHIGEKAAARTALNTTWDTLQSGSSGLHLEYIDRAEAWFRGETKGNLLNPLVDNAIASIIYACQCLEGGCAETAKWTAMQAYDAVDYIAQILLGIDSFSADSEEVILHSIYVQTELGYQNEDLRIIAASTHNTGSTIERIQSRAITGSIEMARYVKQILDNRQP